MRQRELDRLSHLGAEDVLAIFHPALQRPIIPMRRNQQILEVNAEDVIARVAEEGEGGVVGEANAAVAIAHQQQVAHRADDLGSRHRRRHCEAVFPDRVDRDGDRRERRDPTKGIKSDANCRKKVDRANGSHCSSDGKQADAVSLRTNRLRIRANDFDDRGREDHQCEERIKHARGRRDGRLEAPPVMPHATEKVVCGQRHHCELRGEQPREDSNDFAMRRALH